ncbi:MAG: DUF1636 domain-containing protein [Pseudomonadota bacterium]
MTDASDSRPTSIVLSVCLRCRDGLEDAYDGERGGARLAKAIAAAIAEDRGSLPALEARGMRCMSQSARPCTISLGSPDAFTYLFGDLDPDRHAADVLSLLRIYAGSATGFMGRDERPEPMRAGILGRIPPLHRPHEIVEPLHSAPVYERASHAAGAAIPNDPDRN